MATLRIRGAGAPWDDLDADLIVRSSDNVDFRVYKCILAKACRAFDEIFTAQRHPHSPGPWDQEFHDGVPVLHLTEDASTLACLLRLFCPVPAPVFSAAVPSSDPAGPLRAVCAALDKYCVNFFPSAVREALIGAARTDPEAVYVLACRYRLSDVALAAAKRTLRAPRQLQSVPREEIAYISALQYHALVCYQDACRQAAVAVTADFEWVHGDAIPGAVPASAGTATNSSSGSRSKRNGGGSGAGLECGCNGGIEKTLVSVGTRRAGPSTYIVPGWCREYVQTCGALLAKDVRGEAVSNPEVYLPYVKQAWGCNSCAEDAQSKIVEFSKMFAEEIDRRIEEVPLHLPV